MIENRRIAVITFRTHQVWIDQQTNGNICCFKQTLSRCDWELFTSDQLDECSDYILAPLPVLVYAVSILD